MKVLKIFHFPAWWYRDFLVSYFRFVKNLMVFLESKMAVRLMARTLFVPLFHDASLLGRLLSFLFRLVRVVGGVILMLLTVLSLMVWLIAWLMLPIAVGLTFKKVGWLSLGVVWLVDVYLQIGKPRELSSEIDLKQVNVGDYLNKDLRRIISRANGDVGKLKELLSQDNEVKLFLSRLEIVPNSFVQLPNYMIYSEWINQAGEEALKQKDLYVGKEHFVLAFLKSEEWRYKSAIKTLKWLKKQTSWGKTPFLWEKEYVSRPMGGINRAWTGIPTPTLNKFSTDLTALSQKSELPEMFGKKEALKEMTEILSKKNQNNLLVVGESGSGKTTLVKGMAQEIVRGVSAKSLKFKRLVRLDSSRLAAGADDAKLNKRITKMVAEIKAAENIILFVDEVHTLASVNQDSPETSDLFTALEPPLSEGAFQFIGATTTENYKKYIEPNEAFARLFEKVELKEADSKDTLKTLEYVAFDLEKSEKVVISQLSLEKIIDLSGQMMHDRVFPDKAVNLLDEVVAGAKARGEQIITSSEVEKLISKKTKIPITKIGKDEAKVLLELESKMHKRVIGQNEAIKAVADALRRARTQLKDPSKPIASFLFAGPTGVGKTETAKTLAEEFFGSEKQMIRLDMSEYQNIDSINRLIGAPPGKSRVNAGGQLTEAVRHQPYSLLLLDEIEKAHPNILNLFLQVLDDARLTDSMGRLVDFSNMIIITTTNVGTRELISGGSKVKKSLESHYPPEFLNRFTGLIVFKNLNETQVTEIVELKLKKLVSELKKQEIELAFEKQVITKLAKLGFSTKWGGRAIERVIQDKILNVLAKKMLKGEIVKNKQFTFTAEELV